MMIFNRVTPNMLNPEEKNKLQADHNSPLEIASVQEGMNSTFTKSNVKEITGSISGIFGIDSLALTGSELYIKIPNKPYKNLLTLVSKLLMMEHLSHFLRICLILVVKI